MFAIIKTGGKQYKVSKDLMLDIEKIPHQPGDKVNFEDVVFIGNIQNGSSVSDADALKKRVVVAEVVSQYRDKKIIVFKKKRRQNYRRKNGHKQFLTRIKILDIK